MGYETIIGVEVHVEINSKSKAFSSSPNSFGALSNSQTNVIDLGYPGTLPRINEELVNKAIKISLALNCEINREIKFERKNYFYPDNSKNYQITQESKPIGYNGFIDIEIDNMKKRIIIDKIIIEEDTAKSNYSNNKRLLNFNRSGIPLVEIVTKPVFNSSKEVKLFLDKLRTILLYIDVSDLKMEEGSLRYDINISLSDNSNSNNKVEIKNLNSIKNIEKSINIEIMRQQKIYDEGKHVFSETRKYDEKTNQNILLRMKESNNQYMYMIEPDIQPIQIDNNMISKMKNQMPTLPSELLERYVKVYKLPKPDAEILIRKKELSDFFNETVKYDAIPINIMNWLLGDVTSYINKFKANLNELSISPKRLATIISLVDDNLISNKIAKRLLSRSIEEDRDPIEILERENWYQINDIKILEKMISEIFSQNPQFIVDIKNGKNNIMRYIVGQIMKNTNGLANPIILDQILKDKIK